MAVPQACAGQPHGPPPKTGFIIWNMPRPKAHVPPDSESLSANATKTLLQGQGKASGEPLIGASWNAAYGSRIAYRLGKRLRQCH